MRTTLLVAREWRANDSLSNSQRKKMRSLARHRHDSDRSPKSRLERNNCIRFAMILAVHPSSSMAHNISQRTLICCVYRLRSPIQLLCVSLGGIDECPAQEAEDEVLIVYFWPTYIHCVHSNSPSDTNPIDTQN